MHYFFESSQPSEMSTIYYHTTPHRTDDKTEAQKRIINCLRSQKQYAEVGIRERRMPFHIPKSGERLDGGGEINRNHPQRLEYICYVPPTPFHCLWAAKPARQGGKEKERA